MKLYIKLDARQSPTLAHPAAPPKMVVMAASLEKSKKNNFSLIVYKHSSTNPENLAKIGSVDF